MEEGENVCLILGLKIQVKSMWMEKISRQFSGKIMPIVLHLQISGNTLLEFFCKLTESTDVYFYGDDGFLVLYEAVLHCVSL